MATICKGCASSRDINLPPIRTNKEACDICGGFDGLYDKRGNLVRKLDANYGIPDMLMPGNALDPNAIADKEEAEKKGAS